MGDDYEKPSRRERRQKRSWKRPRKNRLTRAARWPETADSLKSTSSTPANSLQGRIFYAPHSVSRAPARLARSLGVSGIRKDPDALVRVESTPTPFRVVLNLKSTRRPSWLI